MGHSMPVMRIPRQQKGTSAEIIDGISSLIEPLLSYECRQGRSVRLIPAMSFSYPARSESRKTEKSASRKPAPERRCFFSKEDEAAVLSGLEKEEMIKTLIYYQLRSSKLLRRHHSLRLENLKTETMEQRALKDSTGKRGCFLSNRDQTAGI